ncbi:NAD-dependent epimerase/dehydratase family protein [Nonomuraea turkmeniaca]|uniref:NAD-dependent epimerase/dehydratase family protein n=1 Tax=Nonomuraea turkmeniaca TaxID=103838 RepID=A0A5S4F379_9ACTN|nr:NAD-dependent epimerase/dehydratase family protein [Nonomuraea turkmeniaca]
MTVLVTGARGNIGRHVVKELLAHHIPGVRALTRHPRRTGEELRAEPARPIEAARASSSPTRPASPDPRGRRVTPSRSRRHPTWWRWSKAI